MAEQTVVVEVPRRYSYQTSLALVGLSLFLGIGGVITSDWLWNSYWWIILSVGLGVAGVVTAWMSGSKRTLVACMVLASIAIWLVIYCVVWVDAFDAIPGGPGDILPF